jgi:hypothetical protein
MTDRPGRDWLSGYPEAKSALGEPLQGGAAEAERPAVGMSIGVLVSLQADRISP